MLQGTGEMAMHTAHGQVKQSTAKVECVYRSINVKWGQPLNRDALHWVFSCIWWCPKLKSQMEFEECTEAYL